MILVTIFIGTSLCQSLQWSIWQNSKHLIAYSFIFFAYLEQQQ